MFGTVFYAHFFAFVAMSCHLKRRAGESPMLDHESTIVAVLISSHRPHKENRESI